jgi:hypothetical protein
MANDLADMVDDRAHGPLELISLARSPLRWTTEERKAFGPETVEQAIAKLRAELAPAPKTGKDLKAWKAALDERLRQLAVKIAPGMSVDQGAAWRDVMGDALSDLPAMVALTAAKRAIHRPMNFMNEIEPVIREIAAEIEAGRREVLARLEWLRGDLERVANPPVSLPDPLPAPFSGEEIRKMSPTMRAMGLGCGALTQDEIDAADAEIQEVKAA